MRAKSRKRLKRYSKALLLQHLEDISWRVLAEYSQVIREMIRRRSGVYALYRKGRLYYVGLANNLAGRLNSHLRDRHHGAWDRFSVYLTARSDHIKELESLLLRIVNPSGNRVAGHFARSENLFSDLNSLIKELDADRRASILGGPVARRLRRSKARRAKGNDALAGFSDSRTPLRGYRHGKTFRASLRKDGNIHFKGRVYSSASSAARAAIKGAVNGWSFWHFKKPGGKWVALKSIRK